MILMIILIYYGILLKNPDALQIFSDDNFRHCSADSPSKQHVLGPLGISGHDHASIDTFLAVLQPVLTCWTFFSHLSSYGSMRWNLWNVHIARHLSPTGSMNGIFTCIDHKKSTINVGKHTIFPWMVWVIFYHHLLIRVNLGFGCLKNQWIST